MEKLKERLQARILFLKTLFSVKELKESRNSLKVLDYIKAGDLEERKWLLTEVEELIAIASKMINNKK
jgi:hypothetical protein